LFHFIARGGKIQHDGYFFDSSLNRDRIFTFEATSVKMEKDLKTVISGKIQ